MNLRPRRWRPLLPLLLTATLVTCATPSPRDAGQHLTLIYSGNMNGELEPCGCSEGGDLGGVRRRASMLHQLRQDDPQLLLISSGGLVGHESSQDRLKGEYIFKGLATMAYDAIGIQWQDLAFGDPLLTTAALPWVASNWRSDNFAREKPLVRGNTRLQFFAWLPPQADPAGKMAGTTRQVDDDPAVLAASLAAARDRGDITLVSVPLPLSQIRQLLPLTNIDVLLIESQHEVYGEPQMIDGTLVLQPGSRGMRLGRVDLQIRDHRITQFQHQVIPLPKAVADAPELAGWYEEFNAKVKENYLRRSAQRKALSAGTSPFVGVDVCAGCHAGAHKVWTGSEHAKAFADLEAVGKSFDPDCLKCHTVGFEQEGGFIDLAMSDTLTNVQCENCHGAGRDHVEAKGAKPLGNHDWKPSQMCGQCHVGSHSPDFKFEVYWPKIVHGR